MSSLTQKEFDELLNDTEKVIVGDIRWSEDEDHSPTKEFLSKVQTTSGCPLILRGSYNREAKTLSFCLLHPTAGRIYALDLGKDHRNPDRSLVGEKHKHKWTPQYRDKQAYVPLDITAPVDPPGDVFEQFCEEANLHFGGDFQAPTPGKGFFDVT